MATTGGRCLEVVHRLLISSQLHLLLTVFFVVLAAQTGFGFSEQHIYFFVVPSRLSVILRTDFVRKVPLEPLQKL